MRYSDLVTRITGRAVAAWDIHSAALADRRAGKEVFVLSVGDPEFATPDLIVDAAVAALRSGDTHYTDVAGRPALRQAIADMFVADFGVPAVADEAIVLAGAQNGLFATTMCLLQSGDEALVPEPMYLTYEAAIRASGATLVPVPVDPDHFRIDVEALARAVTPRSRAIFFANPCNPTGVVMTPEELGAIADLALRHDLWIVADEVYSGIVFDRDHHSIAARPDVRSRTVTLGSLSKSHAMAGWRMGWAVGPADLIAHMENLSLCLHYGLPGFIQQAALAAVEGRVDHVPDMRELYRRRRDLMMAELAGTPGLRCKRPEGGMFLLIDVTATGLSAQDFAWGLYRATGVSTLDAEAFGPSAAGHIRLGFVLNDNRLREAASRIKAYAEALMASGVTPDAGPVSGE